MGGTSWFLVNYVPATGHNGTYTLIDAGTSSFQDQQKFCQYYGFSRAICDSAYVGQFHAAGFNTNQILVGIGYNDANGNATIKDNWQNIVNGWGNQVLGYFFDEPSGSQGGISILPSYMETVQNAVHTVGSKLWLDDFDSGVMPYPYGNYHPAGHQILDHGDYIMCDADNSKWVSGVGGVGCYVGEDYNEFQEWFPGGSQPTFNTIFTMPTFDNRNIGSVVNWMDDHLGNNINTFALWLPPDAWNWAEVDAFASYAYQAGFLGQYQEQQQAKYVCQQDNVGFTPGNGTLLSYYGVWNGTYFSGPVDPSSTLAATLCWQFQENDPTGQFQTVYSR